MGLAKIPDDRFESADAFLAAVKALAASMQ